MPNPALQPGRIRLPISDIVIGDRQRKDYGDDDQEKLIDSLEEHGLIQPVVINQDKTLIAGGRRVAGALALGWTAIDVTYRETMSQRELEILELEENIRRKEMTWQESVCGIARTHQLKAADASLKHEKWGMRQTGDMLGMSLGTIGNASIVAGFIVRGDAEIMACENMMEALKLLEKRKEIRSMQELAARTTPSLLLVAPTTAHSTDASVDPAIFGDSKPLGVAALSAEGLVFPSADAFTVPITSFVLRQPDLTMSTVRGLGEGIADHCICDPPYGIDMAMLDQSNPHGGMNNIDSIEESHTVKGNEDLFREMMPTIFRALKPNGFFVFWCDIMQWQNLYNLAVATGFKVQRWPITWNKVHQCMNQTAQYNFTKSTEIAMVCRKAGATLVNPASGCVVSASSYEVRKIFGDHPFVKPFEVTDFILRHVTFPGQTILEPFAGRGSIVLPILRSGCKIIAVEYSEEHYSYLLENVKQHYLKLNPKIQFV